MSVLDLVVLVVSVVAIAAFGAWQGRGRLGLSRYLKGDDRTGWATIGVSVMATQASAVTFLSMPGQGYQDGLGFVQNYFGASAGPDPDRGGVSADVPAAQCVHGLRVPRQPV